MGERERATSSVSLWGTRRLRKTRVTVIFDVREEVLQPRPWILEGACRVIVQNQCVAEIQQRSMKGVDSFHRKQIRVPIRTPPFPGWLAWQQRVVADWARSALATRYA